MHTNQTKQHQLFYFKVSLEKVNRWWWHFSTVFWSHGFGHSEVSETIFVFFFRCQGSCVQSCSICFKSRYVLGAAGAEEPSMGFIFSLCAQISVEKTPGAAFPGMLSQKAELFTHFCNGLVTPTLHKEQHGFQKENCYATLEIPNPNKTQLLLSQCTINACLYQENWEQLHGGI